MKQTFTRYKKSVAFLATFICLLLSATAKATPINTWTGGFTTSGYALWNDPRNWSFGSVPTSSTNVLIPAGTANEPIIYATAAVANNLEIDLGATPSSNGISVYLGSLTLSGALSGNGYIEVGSNFGAASLTLASSGTNTLGSLVAVVSGVANITSPLTLTFGFEASYGGTVNTNNQLTLASNSLITAQFNYTDYATSAGTINGNVTVQHYIPKDMGAAFRDFGACVTGATVANLGSQVYNYPAGVWSNKLATSTTLTPGQGYRAEVNTASSAVTLTTTGPLVLTNVNPTLNQGANAFTFVANPYAAVLDFTKLTTANLQNGYWYFDPTVVSGGYETYVYYGAHTGSANVYSGGLTLGQYLQPGQGFFVQNASSGTSSLTFSPSATTYTVTETNVFGASALNRIATGLFTNGKNVDGAVVVFNSSFSSGLDNDDATKISNHGENLTFTIAGKDYCTNAFSLPTATDELPMHLYNLSANTTYTLKLDASQYVGNGVDAYIQDNVLNTKTLLTGATNEVSFTTGTDATTDANRFTIVFAPGALPVKSISLTATQLSNKQVAVKWTTIGENNIASYKVERSANGTTFTDLATASPATSHNYSFIDATASVGTNYYRIKATDNTGVVAYSNVAKVSTVDRLPLTVTPNPIVSSSFKLGLATAGTYTVSLVDMFGKTVYTTTINHSTAATLENVSLNSKLATGSYTVKATDANGNVSSTEVIIK